MDRYVPLVQPMLDYKNVPQWATRAGQSWGRFGRRCNGVCATRGRERGGWGGHTGKDNVKGKSNKIGGVAFPFVSLGKCVLDKCMVNKKIRIAQCLSPQKKRQPPPLSHFICLFVHCCVLFVAFSIGHESQVDAWRMNKDPVCEKL